MGVERSVLCRWEFRDLFCVGVSSELRDLLSNPHLQQIICHLNTTTSAPGDIEVAMHEPIFREFADKCLEIVESEESVAG